VVINPDCSAATAARRENIETPVNIRESKYDDGESRFNGSKRAGISFPSQLSRQGERRSQLNGGAR